MNITVGYVINTVAQNRIFFSNNKVDKGGAEGLGGRSKTAINVSIS